MTRHSMESFLGTVFRGEAIVSTTNGDAVKGSMTDPVANSLSKNTYLLWEVIGTFMVFSIYALWS